MDDKKKTLLEKDSSSNGIILFPTTNIRSLYALKLLSDSSFKTSHSLNILMHGLMVLLAGIFYLPALIDDYYGEYLGGYYFGLSAIFLFYATYLEYNFLKKNVDNNIDMCNKLLESRSNSKLATALNPQSFQHSALGVSHYLNMIASFFIFFGGISFIPQTNALNWFGYPLTCTGYFVVILNQAWKVVSICNSEELEYFQKIEISKNEKSIIEKNLEVQADQLNDINSISKKFSFNLFYVSESFLCLNAIFCFINAYMMRDCAVETLVYLTYGYLTGGSLAILSGFSLYYKYFYGAFKSNELRFEDRDYALLA